MTGSNVQQITVSKAPELYRKTKHVVGLTISLEHYPTLTFDSGATVQQKNILQNSFNIGTGNFPVLGQYP